MTDSTTRLPTSLDKPREESPPIPMTELQRALRGLRYGSVTLVLHDGRVTKIERQERIQIDPRTGT